MGKLLCWGMQQLRSSRYVRARCCALLCHVCCCCTHARPEAAAAAHRRCAPRWPSTVLHLRWNAVHGAWCTGPSRRAASTTCWRVLSRTYPKRACEFVLLHACARVQVRNGGCRRTRAVPRLLCDAAARGRAGQRRRSVHKEQHQHGRDGVGRPAAGNLRGGWARPCGRARVVQCGLCRGHSSTRMLKRMLTNTRAGVGGGLVRAFRLVPRASCPCRRLPWYPLATCPRAAGLSMGMHACM